MTSKKHNSKRVLAIDPTSKGFGYVVFDSQTTLADWAGKTVAKQNEAKTLEKLSKLIQHYQPDVLVFEDHRESRRCPRVKKLLEGVQNLATAEGLESRRFTMSRVKKVFATFHAGTKYEIAHAVAQQLPALAPELPRKRKAWMTEEYCMAVFDAAALALTYFISRPLRGGAVPRPLPAPPESAAIPNSM
jgi:Holliday junction resolvasome RuvABC endonuclease subunit